MAHETYSGDVTDPSTYGTSPRERLSSLQEANEHVSHMLDQLLAAEERAHAQLEEAAEEPKPLELPLQLIPTIDEEDSLNQERSSKPLGGKTDGMSAGAVLEAKSFEGRLKVAPSSIGNTPANRPSEGFFASIGAFVADLLHLDS